MRPRSCGEKAGTHAGVNAHNRDWSPLCDECRLFRNDYARARRQAGDAKVKARAASRRRDTAIKLLIARHRSEFNDLLEQLREES